MRSFSVPQICMEILLCIVTLNDLQSNNRIYFRAFPAWGTVCSWLKSTLIFVARSKTSGDSGCVSMDLIRMKAKSALQSVFGLFLDDSEVGFVRGIPCRSCEARLPAQDYQGSVLKTKRSRGSNCDTLRLSNNKCIISRIKRVLFWNWVNTKNVLYFIIICNLSTDLNSRKTQVKWLTH